MKTLFETVVGSHAWKMNKPTSDFDIFQTYQIPTKAILSGGYQDETILCEKVNGNDVSRHEIGSVIEQLLKGNFNFVVGVCSPIVNEDKYGYLAELKDITKRNLAKNIHHSTKGIAMGQHAKYMIRNVHGRTEKELQKKINLIVRSLIFGESILSFGEIIFTKIENQRYEDIQYWIEALDNAYENSKLPEIPVPTEFRNFLYKIRMQELRGSIYKDLPKEI